jgi:hypothetical protein
MEASRQAVVHQGVIVAPRGAIEEAAPLVVLVLLWSLAWANGRASFLMMMMYRPTRMSLCKSGCGGFPALGRALPRSTRQPWLTRRPQIGGSW